MPSLAGSITECHHTLMPGKELVQTEQKRTIKALRSVFLQALCGRLVFSGPILIFSLLHNLSIIPSGVFESTRKLLYLEWLWDPSWFYT